MLCIAMLCYAMLCCVGYELKYYLWEKNAVKMLWILLLFVDYYCGLYYCGLLFVDYYIIICGIYYFKMN